MKKVKTKKQWFEVTRSTVREPLHRNIWTALKCIGLLIVTIITIILKLAGYIGLAMLIVFGYIVKLVNRFVTWLLKKIRK